MKGNYQEGILFHEMKAGDTIYYSHLVHGFIQTYLLEVEYVADKNSISGCVINHSNNGNTPSISEAGMPMSVQRKNCFLRDDRGIQYSFDAMGRIGKLREKDNKDEHPSYGLMSISRYSGGHNTFFGSSIKHDGGISIKISQATVERSLSRDWYNEKGRPIVEVDMSYTQFSEMLTSGMNTQGTPCTISYANGKRVDKCNFTNKQMLFQEEFEKEMKSLKQSIDNLVKDSKEILSAKKAPSKAEKELILSELKTATGALTDRFTFLSSQWNKQLEKTVKEAKGEIEGFYETKVRDLGMKAINNVEMLEIEDEY